MFSFLCHFPQANTCYHVGFAPTGKSYFTPPVPSATPIPMHTHTPHTLTTMPYIHHGLGLNFKVTILVMLQNELYVDKMDILWLQTRNCLN